MKNLKRYELVEEGSAYHQIAVMDECADGDWVKFSDIKDILNSTPNTTKDKIIQTLGNMSAEDRDEIFGNWCRLCGAELPCYCAPCYDE